MDTQTSSSENPSVVEPVPEIKHTRDHKQSSAFIVALLSILKKKSTIFLALGTVVLVILLLLAYAMLGRRSVSGVTSAKTLTLTYWSTMEQTKELKKAFEDFQTANPGVTIVYSYQSPKDYSDRLLSACARGQCPDIFHFHSTWVGEYSNRGVLATLPSSVMSASVFESTFFPSASKDLRTSSGIVGIPLFYDGLGLYINTKILTESGKSVPTTWDELRSLARLLTIRGSDGSVQRSGVAMGTSTNIDHFSDILAALILQNGGNPLQPEAFGSNESSGSNVGKPSLVGDALTFYTLFSKQDKVWNETLPNSTYAFAIERAAMIFAPAYRAAEINKINPNFTFAVYPIPQLPGNPVTPANYWAEGVSSTSKEQIMAWKLLAYLASKPVQEQLYPVSANAVVRFASARQDMVQALSSNPYVGAVLKQGASGKSHPLSSRTFDKKLNDELISLYAGAVSAMQTNATYGQIAQKFAQDVSALSTK